MNAQQLHDLIIKPTLQYMGGNYYSKDAAMLLLATAAIESDCGHYIKQVNGPALGIWQMEPETHSDILANCDAIQSGELSHKVCLLAVSTGSDLDTDLVACPMYACAMARLKYSMDPNRLPSRSDSEAVYKYYKRIYNTPLGASTYEKFVNAWNKHRLSEVKL